eukprot:12092963-Alexandrium_andersonii.AAC.1
MGAPLRSPPAVAQLSSRSNPPSAQRAGSRLPKSLGHKSNSARPMRHKARLKRTTEAAMPKNTVYAWRKAGA